MEIKISREGSVPVSDGIGLFFEDINYGLDGGLSAEMLENRNFEAKDACRKGDGYAVRHDASYGWSCFPEGAKMAKKIKTDRPLFPENPHYMRIETEEGNAGIANKAYDGVYLTKGVTYTVSFYARSYTYRGKVTAGVYDGEKLVVGKSVKLRADGTWHRYSVRFKAKKDLDMGTFALTLKGCGCIHVDCFSMLPDNAVLGLFRKDLVAMMKAMKPGFLRFPGGCIVEGNTLENRYQWKQTLGERDRRKQNWSRWAVHGGEAGEDFHSDYSHYGQTLAIGYYEYFLLCEYLGAKPLPVVSVGLACQYASTECVPTDDPEFETYIQDALDVVEFANGGTDTVWGKVRAEMGHPEPFGLTMLGVGNEQWETETNEFYKRFEIFEQRLHEKYPDLKIVGTVGPTVETPSYDGAWKWLRGKLDENPDFVYCADEHFYVSPEWLYSHVHMYDGYPRKGKVFAGEYAAHIPEAGCGRFNAPQSNTWEGALAEAAFMTGMERNADVVVMASYAPLFARIGYTQWSPDLIWFDGKKAYGTPSYYVQQLFSLYTGGVSLKTVSPEEEKIYASATEREDRAFVKAVNASGEEKQVTLAGDCLGELIRIVCLKGELSDYNTITDPDKISPFEIAPETKDSLTLPPYSVSVLIFQKPVQKG